MVFLRSILTVFCFFVFGMGSLLIGFIVIPLITILVKKDKRRLVIATVIHYAWKLFVSLMSVLRLIKVDTTHLLPLKGCRSTIIVANHLTLIDVVILIGMVPRTLSFVKGALAENFFVKRIVKYVYFVVQDDSTLLFNEATTALGEGFNLVIFPEGTRSEFGEVPFKRGFAHLALLSGYPVLPIRIRCHPPTLGRTKKWYVANRERSKFSFKVGSLCYAADFKDETQSAHNNAKSFANHVKGVIEAL
ncbi:MAG: lysophospholipid acyltransferase family protein [Bdellovibrionota bacterium]|jgi:1-acyl-sn-glycerol-3-phosphate acyltransferase